jgi:hypothetical protein
VGATIDSGIGNDEQRSIGRGMGSVTTALRAEYVPGDFPARFATGQYAPYQGTVPLET